jgi:8-oxo-dGTP pyrophosphatase MutT (NUDIX family)
VNPQVTGQPAVPGTALLAASVIVHDLDADTILLLQRGPTATFGRGQWDLPTGKNDTGEPITVTAVRELHEETGLHVEIEDLHVVHVVHGAHGVEAPTGFLTVVFAAHRWNGTPVNREPAKHTRVRWTPVDQLPEPFVSGTAAVLKTYLTGTGTITLNGWPPPEPAPGHPETRGRAGS